MVNNIQNCYEKECFCKIHGQLLSKVFEGISLTHLQELIEGLYSFSFYCLRI